MDVYSSWPMDDRGTTYDATPGAGGALSLAIGCRPLALGDCMQPLRECMHRDVTTCQLVPSV
jgi:hypothetical protein